MNNISTSSKTTHKSKGFSVKHRFSRFMFVTAIQSKIYCLPAAVVLLLSSCQSQPVLQAYSGSPKADNETASFIVPENFDLQFIDGKPYTHSILVDGITIKVLPGKHEVIVKYLDYWDVNADNHERIESQPIMVSFNAAAGKHYRITTRSLQNIREARLFAENPTVNIVDDSTQQELKTEITTRLDDHNLIAGFDKNSSTPPPATDDTTPSGNTQTNAQKSQASGPALEMLKYWWQQADSEQQQRFLQWVK